MQITLKTTTIDENDIRYYTEFTGKEYSHCSRDEKGLVILHFKDEKCKENCDECSHCHKGGVTRIYYHCLQKHILMGPKPYYTKRKKQKQLTLF